MTGVRVALEERGAGLAARLTIDNPARLNILDSAMMRALIAQVAALGEDAQLRAVVLTGAGERAFIGGADINEMAALTRESAAAFITLVHRACDCLRALAVPVIARIGGHALGAGLEIAASCDLRIAASTATFGMPELRVGIPSVVEAALLPGLIGWGRTRRLLLTGETIGADEALRWGLVDKVVAPAQLDAALDAWLDAILAAGAHAIGLQKALLREWEALPLAAAIQAGIKRFAQAWDSDEPSRMMRAFLERRRPGKNEPR